MLRWTINRCLANSLARTDSAAQRLARGSQVAAASVVRLASQNLADQMLRPGQLTRAQLIARAIVATPYGEPLRLDTPLLISCSILNSCSQPCLRCSASLVPPRHATLIMPRSDLWKQLCSLGCPQIALTGGEPLDHPSFDDLVSEIIEHDIAVFVFTHANPAQVARVARRFGRRVTSVFSLYGDLESHDRQRGPGSFDRTNEACARCSDAGGRYAINCVIGGAGLGALRYLASPKCSLRPAKVIVTRTIAAGRGRMLPARESDLPELQSLAREVSDRLHCKVDDHTAAPPDVLRNRKWPLAMRLAGVPAWTGCSVGQWGMHIDADGRGRECPFAETVCGPCGPDGNPREQWKAIQHKYSSRHGECHVEASNSRHVRLTLEQRAMLDRGARRVDER